MIKVLIADDSPIFRSGLGRILTQDREIEVVGGASNGEEAAAMCDFAAPDIVLMDMRMPGSNGVIGTKLIKEKSNRIKIIVLTTFDDDEYIREALRNGADGYILKGVNDEDLIASIKSTMRGFSVFENKVLNNVKDHYKTIKDPTTVPNINLTNREKELLGLIVDGKTNREIASELCLAEGTIRNMVSSLLMRFALNDRTQLAIYAIKNDLV